MEAYKHIPIDEVFERLRCTQKGLTSDEAFTRMQYLGLNRIQDRSTLMMQQNKVQKFLRSMWTLDWLMRMAVFIANSIIANGDAESLVCVDPKTMVLRDGQWFHRHPVMLVPGDIVKIKCGDIVPADARLFEGHNLEIDDSFLTGRSCPIIRESGQEVYSGSTCTSGQCKAVVIATGEHTLFAKAEKLASTTNRIGVFQQVFQDLLDFCMCSVILGGLLEFTTMQFDENRRLTSYTGQLWILLIGGIPTIVRTISSAVTNESLSAIKKPEDSGFEQGDFEVGGNNLLGHFQKVLKTMGDFCISSVALGGLVEVILMQVFQDRRLVNPMSNIWVLIVGGMPIVLPIVLSLTMATGVNRLYQQGAIMKQMSVIKEMAGMDVLCIDNSESLTLNKITANKNLAEVFLKGVSKDELVMLAARAARTESQGPIDAAIISMLKDPYYARADITEINFEVSSRTTITYVDSKGRWWRATKGDPAEILALVLNGKKIAKKVYCTIDKFATKGLSSLAVARQEVPAKFKESPGHPWEFVGLIPLLDSTKAIHQFEVLGIKVKLISESLVGIPLAKAAWTLPIIYSAGLACTGKAPFLSDAIHKGDQLRISKKTARRLGIGRPIGTTGKISTKPFLSSTILEQQEDNPIAALLIDGLVENAHGIASVSPEHKCDILNTLQEKYICGVTGNGVNDAPALKKAHIGFAHSDATEVAKSASDIILTESGLGVIIHTVLTSRAIVQGMKSSAVNC